jgi:hypothetical protein
MTAIKRDRDRIYASVRELLDETTRLLPFYIKGVLQSLSRDWWQRYVLNSLKHDDSVKYKNKEIVDLDLTRLLRVLTYNWNDFREKKNLTSDDRNYAEEMRSVRHRWAHTAARDLPFDIIYRDLDTLQRFAGVIKAPDVFIAKVKAVKEQVGPTPPPPPPPKTFKELLEARINLPCKETRRYTNFYKGGRVKLQLHPNPLGVDLAIPEADENLPSCNILKKVEIESLSGYSGPNKDWLIGNGRFTERRAVAFHLPEEMKDNSEHPGWKEFDMLVEYAENR